MCGIVGILDFLNSDYQIAARKLVLESMLEPLLARGPDANASWHDSAVSLGHTRLTVIDLSKSSAQPLEIDNGDFVIVYNGEIYNYQALRIELKGAGEEFFSSGDTEVLLRGFRRYGLKWLRRLNGMFAAAVWNKREKELTLFRDRFGTKPLYWTLKNGKLLFASLIASIIKNPEFKSSFNINWLNQYLSFQYVHGDATPFEGLYLLEAGKALVFNEGSLKPEEIAWAEERKYLPCLDMSFESASESISSLFEKAVTSSLVSDVEIGSYLSGGIDSGAVVAVASKHQKQLNTFTSGFDDYDLPDARQVMDETEKARQLALAAGCKFHQTKLAPAEIALMHSRVLRTIEEPRLGVLYQNDRAAKLASSSVKVCLSGAGGDELFGGYPWRYRSIRNAKTREDFIKGYYSFWQRAFNDNEKSDFIKPQILKQIDLKQALESFSNCFPQDIDYSDLGMRTWLCLKYESEHFLHALLQIGDRLAGAYGLEERYPFLDNELLAFVDQIPAYYHWDSNESPPDGSYKSGKRLLRASLSKLLAPEFAGHAKQGFSIPAKEWFDGPLSGFVKGKLARKSARIFEYLQYEVLEHAIGSNRSGKSVSAAQLWSLLSLEELLDSFF